jgi:hypothetical protein
LPAAGQEAPARDLLALVQRFDGVGDGTMVVPGRVHRGRGHAAPRTTPALA